MNISISVSVLSTFSFRKINTQYILNDVTTRPCLDCVVQPFMCRNIQLLESYYSKFNKLDFQEFRSQSGRPTVCLKLSKEELYIWPADSLDSQHQGRSILNSLQRNHTLVRENDFCQKKFKLRSIRLDLESYNEQSQNNEWLLASVKGKCCSLAFLYP